MADPADTAPPPVIIRDEREAIRVLATLGAMAGTPHVSLVLDRNRAENYRSIKRVGYIAYSGVPSPARTAWLWDRLSGCVRHAAPRDIWPGTLVWGGRVDRGLGADVATAPDA